MSRLQEELENHQAKISEEIRFLRNRECEGETASGNPSPQQDTAVQTNSDSPERTPEEIINDLFTYHPVYRSDTVLKYEMVRGAAKHLAVVIWKACPYGADRTAAIRKLREAVMTANAAIALNGRQI